MDLRPNIEATVRIREADTRGVPLSQLQALYIEQNCFGLESDSSIHRVMAVEHFLEDVRSNRLTLPQAGGATWGDPNENPLLSHEFTTSSGENLGAVFNHVAKDIYAQCWTVDECESQDAWARFSHGSESVRVSSTPRKVLSRLMNTADPFYGLSYFIGAIHYVGQNSEEWLRGTEISDFLDSLGIAFVLSTHILPDAYRSEKEARLIYFEHSSAGQNTNTVLADSSSGINLRRIPFDWQNVTDQVILGPTVTPETRAELEKAFLDLGIICPVKRSAFSAMP